MSCKMTNDPSGSVSEKGSESDSYQDPELEGGLFGTDSWDEDQLFGGFSDTDSKGDETESPPPASLAGPARSEVLLSTEKVFTTPDIDMSLSTFGPEDRQLECALFNYECLDMGYATLNHPVGFVSGTVEWDMYYDSECSEGPYSFGFYPPKALLMMWGFEGAYLDLVRNYDGYSLYGTDPKDGSPKSDFYCKCSHMSCHAHDKMTLRVDHISKTVAWINHTTHEKLVKPLPREPRPEGGNPLPPQALVPGYQGTDKMVITAFRRIAE
ncbi:hypothetical protein KIPB_005269 [Kipferlia bialata]|uniref:Uncharacterized protein n=1 Tax=Kipferlia bialata TaxID=797122 RepID=A0A9K3CWT0_9EUKA|nr:hypothetical protein KIPB_005269 [Kipferlia bialata]|eukprot:g5269.t1